MHRILAVKDSAVFIDDTTYLLFLKRVFGEALFVYSFPFFF
jgi:hypothetical protein